MATTNTDVVSAASAAATADANHIMKGCLHKTTIKKYDGHYATFVRYMTREYPSLFTDGVFNLALVTMEQHKSFLGYIMKKRDNDGNALDPVEYQQYQSVSGYKSAIVHKYNEFDIKIDDAISKMFATFFAGYKREIAQMKLDGDMSAKEGKSPLSFVGYNFLAREALNTSVSGQMECGTFSWTFLLLCWNLLARCNSICTILFEHISWDEDCLVIKFPRMKNDPDGKNGMVPKHVFANRQNPEICPILALAVYVFTMGNRPFVKKPTLFGGSLEAENKFSKWLSAVLANHESELLSMGFLPKELATHSFRKGAATFLSGQPGGANPVSIYLRAGWNLGSVQSRYIMDGQGGDNLCGRAATGLALTSPRFADLPPHFNQKKGNVLTNAEWEFICPGYLEYFPPIFKQVLPYLLASLIFHQDWLKENLPPNHPLFNQTVWKGETGKENIMVKLKDKVLTGCGDNDVSGMHATGVPPHVIIAGELAAVKDELAAVKSFVGKQFAELPEKLKASILLNFTVEGVAPITARDVELMLTTLEQKLVHAIAEAGVNSSSGSSSSATHPMMNADGTRCLQAEGWSLFNWGTTRGWHRVPVDFRFPT